MDESERLRLASRVVRVAHDDGFEAFLRLVRDKQEQASRMLLDARLDSHDAYLEYRAEYQAYKQVLGLVGECERLIVEAE